MRDLLTRRFDDTVQPGLEDTIGEDLHGVAEVDDCGSRQRLDPVLTRDQHWIQILARFGGHDLQAAKPGEEDGDADSVFVRRETQQVDALDHLGPRVVQNAQEVSRGVGQTVELGEHAWCELELLFQDA